MTLPNGQMRPAMNVAIGIGGLAVGGFVHSLLQPGHVWFNLAVTAGSTFAAGSAFALVAHWLARRKRD